MKRWLLGGLLISCAAFSMVKTTPFPLRYPASFGNRISVPDDNPTTIEGVELGRYLFYDTLLSKNNTISCSSCHHQNKAFTDGFALSVGVSGRPTLRNAMSLANLLWVRDFFWDGHASSLEEQALVPMAHPDEMGLPPEKAAEKLNRTTFYPEKFRKAFGTESITPVLIARALAQFERTLISADSRYDRFLSGKETLSAAEKRGLAVFEGSKGNCTHCHGGAKFFQNVFHNNGLDASPLDPGRQEVTTQEADFARFRVPTLRNIAVTGPYMHDGRFKTLEEVVAHYSDHVHASRTLSPELSKPIHLSTLEKQDLVVFLRTLTDSTFLTNPAFSNPFVQGRRY